MHPKFIIRNIINGCFFKLLNETTGECFNYASGEHDKDEVIVMAEPELEIEFGEEFALMPMCNIYPKEESKVVTEAFTMELLPKQMTMFGNFWLSLLYQKETNIAFSFIKRTEGPLIECLSEV